MRIDLNVEPYSYQGFQVGQHWPQCELNDWFGKMVEANIFTTQNMGAIVEAGEPSIMIHSDEGDRIANKGDWVMISKENGIFIVPDDVFVQLYHVVDESK